MRVQCLIVFALEVGGCDAAFDLERVSDGNQGSACPDTFDITLPGQSSRYQLDTAARQYASHGAICGNVLAGRSHLAAFETTEEHAAMHAYMKMQSRGLILYVGLLQLEDQDQPTGGWMWVTGGAPEPSIWFAGEPNDQDGAENDAENCAAIKVSDILDGDAGLLTDRSPADSLAGLCECEPP